MVKARSARAVTSQSTKGKASRSRMASRASSVVRRLRRAARRKALITSEGKWFGTHTSTTWCSQSTKRASAAAAWSSVGIFHLTTTLQSTTRRVRASAMSPGAPHVHAYPPQSSRPSRQDDGYDERGHARRLPGGSAGTPAAEPPLPHHRGAARPLLGAPRSVSPLLCRLSSLVLLSPSDTLTASLLSGADFCNA